MIEVHSVRWHEVREGRKGTAVLFLLIWVPRPLYPWETAPLPIVQEAGWASEPVWTGDESLALIGFDPRTVQPVASRYTGYTIPAALRTER